MSLIDVITRLIIDIQPNASKRETDNTFPSSLICFRNNSSREFYRSVKCLDRHEMDLIPVNLQSKCSRKKAFYYYYGDLAVRLQLAINVCEENPYN